MYAVIFRATIQKVDAEYSSTAQVLRKAALEEFGCLDFVSVTEGAQEIAVSYWLSLEHIARWKAHLAHQHAQQKGREKWYASYQVGVTEVVRSYRHPHEGA